MKYGIILILSFTLNGCGTSSGGSDGFNAIYNTSSAIINKESIDKNCKHRVESLRDKCVTKRKEQTDVIKHSIEKQKGNNGE